MTDAEQKRINAICEMAHIDDISDLSDGYHTFRQLYYQRMILFAALVKQNRDKAWKSLRHEDGELCFGGGWFIVGIDTPKGSYTYHYEDAYFSLFDCEELERGKAWDGHTEKDVVRLLSLEQQSKWIPMIERDPTDEEKAEYFAQHGEELCYVFENEMPLNGQEVLVSTKSGIVIEDIFYEEFYGFDNIDIRDVTAWMPLPNAYKESEDENE